MCLYLDINVAEDMVNMARSLKQTAKLANKIIKEDNQVYRVTHGSFQVSRSNKDKYLKLRSHFLLLYFRLSPSSSFSLSNSLPSSLSLSLSLSGYIFPIPFSVICVTEKIRFGAQNTRIGIHCTIYRVEKCLRGNFGGEKK